MPVKNHVPLVSRYTLRNSKLRRPTEGTHLIAVSVDERQDAASRSNRSRPEDTWRVMQEKIHGNVWPQERIFEKSVMRIGQIRYSQVSSGACSNSQAVKSSRNVKLSNSSINCSSFSIGRRRMRSVVSVSRMPKRR